MPNWRVHEFANRGSRDLSSKEFCYKRSRKMGQILERGGRWRKDFFLRVKVVRPGVYAGQNNPGETGT
jgi:hypothetical protein